MRMWAMSFLTLGTLVGCVGLLGGADEVKADKKVEQEVRKLEEDWVAADFRKDVATVRQILSDDYEVTTPTGEVRNKEDTLREMKSGGLTVEAAEYADKKVRVYGDTAVITAKFIITKGKFKGTDLAGEYRYTNVFVKKDGRWQCVSGQFTPIVKK